MKGYAYYNGQIGKCDDIKIPLSDRIIFFGDGVYDVMIGHGGKLFMPEEHLDRLYSNMKYLHINILLTKKHFFDLINDLIKSYSDDGLHLNANGFIVWTSILKGYLV